MFLQDGSFIGQYGSQRKRGKAAANGPTSPAETKQPTTPYVPQAQPISYEPAPRTPQSIDRQPGTPQSYSRQPGTPQSYGRQPGTPQVLILLRSVIA